MDVSLRRNISEIFIFHPRGLILFSVDVVIRGHWGEDDGSTDIFTRTVRPQVVPSLVCHLFCVVYSCMFRLGVCRRLTVLIVKSLFLRDFRNDRFYNKLFRLENIPPLPILDMARAGVNKPIKKKFSRKQDKKWNLIASLAKCSWITVQVSSAAWTFFVR